MAYGCGGNFLKVTGAGSFRCTRRVGLKVGRTAGDAATVWRPGGQLNLGSLSDMWISVKGILYSVFRLRPNQTMTRATRSRPITVPKIAATTSPRDKVLDCEIEDEPE
jgi:hypothetical protein